MRAALIAGATLAGALAPIPAVLWTSIHAKVPAHEFKITWHSRARAEDSLDTRWATPCINYNEFHRILYLGWWDKDEVIAEQLRLLESRCYERA